MFKQALKAITSVFVIFILCVVSYKIGVYSDRIPKAKDIPKYLMNFPKYREFLKIIGSKELLPPLSTAKYIPRYLKERTDFINLGGKINVNVGSLDNYDESAGISGGCYFHQDLIVASYIYKNSPVRHIDIGSRFDGFIAHVASFRKIEVMDIRDLGNKLEAENIYFTKVDLMNEQNIPENITDSMSSLHALEHFGLGRYGDKVDPEGYIKGFNNMLKMLKPGGVIYVSFPIGRSTEVLFNVHREFSPLDVMNWVNDKDSVELVRFDYVDCHGELHQDVNLQEKLSVIESCSECGIYTFKKLR